MRRLQGLLTGIAVLATAALAAHPAIAESDDESFLPSFVVGDYALIGREPGGGGAYAGTARIDRVEDRLVLERRIDGRTVRAAGRLEPALHGETEVLRFRWQDGAPMAMTCLVSGDLDNYARLTCLWDVVGLPPREPGLEALFPTATWPLRTR